MIRTQTFVFFLLLHMSLFGQKAGINPKTTLGINLPILVDNTYEFSLRQQFKNRIRADFSFGWSPDTRNKFRNGKNDYATVVPEPNTYYTYTSEMSSGHYFKLALNGVFQMPELFYTGENGNFRFYAGPMLAVSNYQQKGNVIKNVYKAGSESSGTSGLPAQETTQKQINEQGKIWASGLSMGLSMAETHNVSCDVGFDILGFKRNSALANSAHTIGLGTNLVIRLNYQIIGAK